MSQCRAQAFSHNENTFVVVPTLSQCGMWIEIFTHHSISSPMFPLHIDFVIARGKFQTKSRHEPTTLCLRGNRSSRCASKAHIIIRFKYRALKWLTIVKREEDMTPGRVNCEAAESVDQPRGFVAASVIACQAIETSDTATRGWTLGKKIHPNKYKPRTTQF